MFKVRFTAAALFGMEVLLLYMGAHAESPMNSFQNFLSGPQDSAGTAAAPPQTTTTASLPNWDLMGIRPGITVDEAKSLVLKQWPQAVFSENRQEIAQSSAGKPESPPQVSVKPSPTITTEALGYEVGFDQKIIGVVHVKGFPYEGSPLVRDVETAFVNEYGKEVINATVQDAEAFTVDSKTGAISETLNVGASNMMSGDRSCGLSEIGRFSRVVAGSHVVTVYPSFLGNGRTGGRCALLVGLLASHFFGGANPNEARLHMAWFQAILFSPLLINQAWADREAAEADFNKRTAASRSGQTKF